ncbi:Asp-tRNA(Asn)/Glu-tRNA(Gln) amidotransferase subunit GatC [Candidatus Desantisbacteria bacterium]|nr:Asp-tRNA(Asn)/Glu-tRNA(Gln) amidotransferase subunit GatC [Candidatus Desantisbacteria bacterium]
MSITINETEKIARLARLEINEDEKEIFTKQLTDILKYIEKLNNLNTDNITPTAHILPITNVYREDNPESSLPQEKVLVLAPEKEKGCFKVPKVIE